MDGLLVSVSPPDHAGHMALRPILRPGALLLRRDANHLQIGTSPGIVVPDRPGLLPLLRLLDGVRDVERLQSLASEGVPELRTPVAALLDELRAAGAVVDGSDVDAERRRRSGRVIDVLASTGATELAAATWSVLASSGVDAVAPGDPELHVIMSLGEPPRSVYEQAAVHGLAHLPVVVDEQRVRIGPLVRPGRTPCTTCYDLHRTDWDPAWPVVLAQLGRLSTPVGPLALSGLAAHAAAVEVAAEVLAVLDGRTPRTVGACLVVGPAHDERLVRPVAFHHRCACDLLDAA